MVALVYKRNNHFTLQSDQVINVEDEDVKLIEGINTVISYRGGCEKALEMGLDANVDEIILVYPVKIPFKKKYNKNKSTKITLISGDKFDDFQQTLHALRFFSNHVDVFRGIKEIKGKYPLNKFVTEYRTSGKIQGHRSYLDYFSKDMMYEKFVQKNKIIENQKLALHNFQYLFENYSNENVKIIDGEEL